MYSAPDKWAEIFGTHAAASIPHTYEWTYETFTSSLVHPPGVVPDRQRGGGLRALVRPGYPGLQVRTDVAVIGGGGSHNGVGDFDQIDANRAP